MKIRIDFAENKNDFLNAKLLFIEYAESLEFSLRFQDFDEEINNIPGKYSKPDGCIILAWDNSDCVGCIAMRPSENFDCEIKRLYVKPSYRSIGLGRLLTEKIVEYCKERKYSKIRLDTVNRMQSAIGLYKSLGFVETVPYYNNPLPDVLYFELNIADTTIL